MRIWLSGGRGFTGVALWRVLAERGDIVKATTLDVRNRQLIRDEIRSFAPDAVIHLAAISQPMHEPVLDFYDINVLGTEAVLSAASEVPELKRVIVASSATVYGNAAKQSEVLSEAMEPKPIGHYAISKLAMERLIQSYPELPMIITRPFNYAGPGQSDAFLLGKVASQLRQQATRIELGSLDLERDFTSLDEVLNVYLQCLDRCSFHQGVVNICSGKAQSLRSLVECLIEEAGGRAEIGHSEHLKRGVEIETLRGDITRLTEWIGYVPKPLGRADLRRMLFFDE